MKQDMEIFRRFLETRKETLDICSVLERDDYMVQSTPETSPPKWHLGHTSWFFETFVLVPFHKSYKQFNPKFSEIFNSYYNELGDYLTKPKRMLLSRPSLDEVLQYRNYVERSLEELLSSIKAPALDEVLGRVVLGINHEQQHQELLIMDIKENMYNSPFRPTLGTRYGTGARAATLGWIKMEGGLAEIGSDNSAFSFDNELPRHKVFLYPYKISTRLVTNLEYTEFIEDGGYEKPELWLSSGWETLRANGWHMPHYWEKVNGEYRRYTLAGMSDIDPDQPVSHVSYYEADAYARWIGASLPTEVEWEFAFSGPHVKTRGEGKIWEPAIQSSEGELQGPGGCWEWTSSVYAPYPGFKPLEGALGEYNGKFMSQQMILRGECSATPTDHSRITYRNFYHPESRWQISGIRLRKGVDD